MFGTNCASETEEVQVHWRSFPPPSFLGEGATYGFLCACACESTPPLRHTSTRGEGRAVAYQTVASVRRRPRASDKRHYINLSGLWMQITGRQHPHGQARQTGAHHLRRSESRGRRCARHAPPVTAPAELRVCRTPAWRASLWRRADALRQGRRFPAATGTAPRARAGPHG